MEQNGQANGRRVRAEETDITRFKNEISRRAIVMTLVFAVFGILVIAVLFALGHVSFKPVAVKYLYGLLVGLCVAQMNFVILARTLEAMLASGKRGLLPLSYMLRLLIYGGFFYACARQSYVAGLACVLGFMSIKAVMYYFYGVKPKFSADRKTPEWADEWDRAYDAGERFDAFSPKRASGFKSKKLSVVKKYKKSRDNFE